MVNGWRSYDDVAEVYERVHAPRTGMVATDLVTYAGVDPGERVLDVGTGTGVATEAAAGVVEGHAGIAIGVDVSLPMLVTGRKVRPDLHFVGGEVIDLPFRDATFDVVTSTFVLQHFTRYDTALFDMLRVTRSGGRVAAATWGANIDDLERSWRSLLEERTGPDMLRDVQKQASPWRARFEDRELLEETFVDAGMRSVRTERREYRFTFRLEEWIEGRAALPTGRFVKQMLGDQIFATFLDHVRSVFADRFSDPLNDFRDVWFAVGTKS
ncbi:MAG: methyltransferase domain-containing protein [Actinomycetota bacterium]